MSYYMNRVEEELHYLSRELKKINSKKRKKSKKVSIIQEPEEETYWIYLPLSGRTEKNDGMV